MKKLGFVLVGVTALTVGAALLVHHLHRSDAAERRAAFSEPSAADSSAPRFTTHVDGTQIKAPMRVATPGVGKLRIYVHFEGKPVADCHVEFHSHGLNAKDTLANGQTDAAGVLLADHLPVGEWELSVRQHGYVPKIVEVDVTKDRTTDISMALEKGGKFAGMVTDRDGQRLAGAEVNVLDERECDVGPAYHVKANELGEYEIDGIPLVRCGVAARFHRYKMVHKMGYSFVRNGQVERADFTLDMGKTISGYVTSETGEPIAGAHVHAAALSDPSDDADASMDGSFELVGLGDRPQNLNVSAAGYGTVFLHDIAPGSTGVKISLPKEATIAGSVTAEAPPGRFTIALSRWDDFTKSELTCGSHQFINEGKGVFVLKGLAPGAYAIWAVADGYVDSEKTTVAVERGVALDGLVLKLTRKP